MEQKHHSEQAADGFLHRLFDEEYGRLVSYAAAIFKARGGKGSARIRGEEAVQEMFLTAWTHREELMNCEKPVGWLYSTLYYKVLELLRSDVRWTKRLLKYGAHYTPRAESALSLETELGGIVPEEDLALLNRIYREGYSYQELSDELHISKSALAARVHRIKQKLRSALQE